MIPIQLIFVRPQTKKSCAYNINTSPDTHSMTYEEMYHFIGERVKGDVIQKIYELICRKEAFVVDVENATVYEMLIDYEEFEKVERTKLNSINNKVLSEHMAYKPPKHSSYVRGDQEVSLIQNSLLKSRGKR